VVRDEPGGPAIACARLLDGAGALAAGGFYSQQEFDLTRVLTLPGRLLELGRVCVAPERRGGAALAALWSGLARAAAAAKADHLIGCASVPFDPETEALAPLRETLRARWTPDALRAYPRRPVPRDAAGAAKAARLPALLAAYLRLGAKVAGEPGWDPDFGTADFLVVVPVPELLERRFFGRRAEAVPCVS
jgi:putative hemolysin